jgi:hypothetical protein
MKGIILLNYDDDTRQVEKEEKRKFLYNLLGQLDVPMGTVEEGDPFSVENRIKLRSLLSKYNIQVIDQLGDKMEIYIEGELIAWWQKSTYKLKKDLSQLDPKKQLFLEMQVEYWSVFEK